jgi:hypothetical protein
LRKRILKTILKRTRKKGTLKKVKRNAIKRKRNPDDALKKEGQKPFLKMYAGRKITAFKKFFKPEERGKKYV